MGVGIYYFYHGFGLKAFEGRHIRIDYIQLSWQELLELGKALASQLLYTEILLHRLERLQLQYT